MQRSIQSGFTLYEIVFAIVIMLLLVTIMVMGQDLTINSQVHRIEHDFRSIQTAIYDSQDGASSKHGGARKVSVQLQDATVLNDSGAPNVIIEGNWNSSSGMLFKLWRNIHQANLTQGLTDKNRNAHDPLKLPGGVIGVSETDNALIAGLNGYYTICTNNIAGKLVTKLDLVMDDGNTATGSMRTSSSIGGTAIATDSIVDSTAYVVCLGVL
jgi:type II secretory pathway pseudopilin PulG